MMIRHYIVSFFYFTTTVDCDPPPVP